MMERKYFLSSYGRVSYLFRKGEMPIVGLHGLGSSSKSFAKLDSLIDKKFSLYFIDFLGHGESEKNPEGYSIDDQIMVLKEFMDKELSNIEPLIMGNSYGGWISILYTIKFNFTRGLILIDSAGLNPPVGEFGEKYIELFVESISKDEYDKMIFKNMIMMNSKRRRIDPEELKKIKCKTVIIWGRDDYIIDISYAEKFHEFIENSKLYIINGGHMPMLDNPTSVSEIINKEF